MISWSRATFVAPSAGTFSTSCGAALIDVKFHFISAFGSDDATGINELAKQGITIYPNPTHGVFYINNETNEEMQLMIMDVAGRLVVNKTLYNSINTIDISEQSSGIYIIQLTRGEDTYNSKLILK